MPKISAGILIYRIRDDNLEVLLVHPGGPLFRNKDEGAWSIPKGETDGEEDLLAVARRELAEETGLQPAGPFIALSPIKQKGGKIVHAWACAGDCDPAQIKSNTFSIEWPPKSGRQQEFPEIDRAEFFDLATAKEKINPAQAAFLDELASSNK
ncbi:MAG TPA: NUDIX domain-containing protein [Pirellulales bacterium]|nr:NUDIX domain-containing protein [Pirellulales bacterium]